jgi:hypothetical protein
MEHKYVGNGMWRGAIAQSAGTYARYTIE